MTTPVLEAAASAQRDALAERIFKATIESFELLHLYVGERLGLYRALADLGGANAAELAAAAGVAERYAREWLEQQAVAGVVEVAEDPDGEAARRYRLPAGHAEVLLDGDSESYMAPLTRGVASVARTIPAVLEAFRSGSGVPYEDYGPDLRASIALLNRPMFLNQLASRWLPALPALRARLQADPPAQVADVGCGAGWSSIAIALAYPKATVHGLDLDEASIAEAPPAPVAEPKQKRKRVPRGERRQRSKPKREKPAERKPIVRQPKPEHVRGRRKERRGVVVSAAMDKTIVVRVDTVKPHPVYKKIVRHSTRLRAHDEGNTAKPGDLVRLVETRPLSKSKHWRLAEVLEEAK